MNEKFRAKVLVKCGTLRNFCRLVGYTYHGIRRIFNGDREGSIDFWYRAKEILGISEKEVWEYMTYHYRKHMEVKSNEKGNKDSDK